MEPPVQPLVTDAVDFLLSQQRSDSLWTDYGAISNGSSDEWVAAYVASALTRTDDTDAVRATQETAKKLIRRRWWSAGWGYNNTIPADADSTSWVLRLLDRCGTTAPVSRWRARRFVSDHLSDTGGISTYEGHRISSDDRSYHGWTMAHPSVTAAAAPYLPKRASAAATSYLQKQQTPSGYWTGYWWSDPAYPTAVAASWFARTGNWGSAVPPIRWAADAVGERGAVESASFAGKSPFATACCLRILSLWRPDVAARSGDTTGCRDSQCAENLGDVPERIRAVIEWLQREQSLDGSWPASAVMRMPPPDVTDAESYKYTLGRHPWGGEYLDRNRTFTTATVLDALRHAREWRESYDESN